MKFGVLCAAAALALSAGSASAAVITQRITFTAYDFQAYYGPLPAPTDPLTGVFLVTYDPDQDTNPTTVGLQVLSLNIPHPDVKFAYDYVPAVSEGYLALATKPNAGGGFSINAIGDFGILIDNIRANPSMGYAQFAVAGGNYYTFTGDVTVATVPEPQTWALLIAGFGLAGAALRRRFMAA